jgi:hypothetical protein
MPTILFRKTLLISLNLFPGDKVIHIGDRKGGLDFLISFFSLSGHPGQKDPAKSSVVAYPYGSASIVLNNLRNALISQLYKLILVLPNGK